MQELERKSIVQMAMGAIQERVDYEMSRIIDNIIDVNTKATGKRTLIVKIDLTPADDRKTIAVSAVAQSKLQATNAVATSLYVTSDHNGELAVVEMVPQIPGQMNFDQEEQQMPPRLKLVCNN